MTVLAPGDAFRKILINRDIPMPNKTPPTRTIPCETTNVATTFQSIINITTGNGVEMDSPICLHAVDGVIVGLGGVISEMGEKRGDTMTACEPTAAGTVISIGSTGDASCNARTSAAIASSYVGGAPIGSVDCDVSKFITLSFILNPLLLWIFFNTWVTQAVLSLTFVSNF